jgi:hypothetical protein
MEDGGEYVQAYRRLKVEMEKQKSHEEELNFFGLEMLSRSALMPKWRRVSFALTPTRSASVYVPTDGMAIALYGALSDFGRSFTRPLMWLALLIAIFSLLYVPFVQTLGAAVSLSAINTFGVFFGVRDEFVDHIDLKARLAFRVLAAIQTVGGTALLFLSLLALQKKLRMK